MHNLITDIKNTVSINDSDLQRVLDKFHKKEYDKSDIIPSYATVSKHMKFIEKGLVRVYIIDNQAREITIQIGIESAWINDLYSYLSDTTSNIYLTVYEPTTILQIHKNDLEQLYKEVPAMESFSRIKIQQSYTRLYNRAFNQLNKTAEERYLEFRDKYGYIEPRVPQYIIASYLNISPEHLSKVRHDLLKK